MLFIPKQTFLWKDVTRKSRRGSFSFKPWPWLQERLSSFYSQCLSSLNNIYFPDQWKNIPIYFLSSQKTVDLIHVLFIKVLINSQGAQALDEKIVL